MKIIKNNTYGVFQEGERSEMVGAYTSHLGQRRRCYHRLGNPPGGARIWGQSLGTPDLNWSAC